MLSLSEAPEVTLSNGKFGTQAGLGLATVKQPSCAEPFGQSFLSPPVLLSLSSQGLSVVAHAPLASTIGDPALRSRCDSQLVRVFTSYEHLTNGGDAFAAEPTLPNYGPLKLSQVNSP